jgi:hypothetical protein
MAARIHDLGKNEDASDALEAPRHLELAVDALRCQLVVRGKKLDRLRVRDSPWFG